MFPSLCLLSSLGILFLNCVTAQEESVFDKDGIVDSTTATTTTTTKPETQSSISSGSTLSSKTQLSYTCFDDASWAIFNTTLSDHILGSNRQQIYDQFIEQCTVAAGVDNAEELCHVEEQNRLYQNRYQPSSVYNYTKYGFDKVRAPDALMQILNEFWINNQDDFAEMEYGGEATIFHNIWDNEPTMILVEDTELIGGGYPLRAMIANMVRDIMEDWTGMRLAISSVYGIRTYYNGSILTPHVDRLPLVTSAILNVAQDVDEDWPLEVYDHNGVAHNITMVPGDLVLYESHSIIHGRPFPLNGRYYANIFIHFEPIGPLKIESSDHSSTTITGDLNGDKIKSNDRDNVEINDITDNSINLEGDSDEIRYPPYLIPGSVYADIWLEENPNGWNLFDDALRLFTDGDLKTIQYVAQVNPSIVHGTTDDWEPIHEAVMHGHYDIVQYLILEQGISVHTLCNNTKPIDVAYKYLAEDHPIITFLQDFEKK